MQKDLRNVLGKRERGRYSHVYCGGPVREPVSAKRLRRVQALCRGVLLSTLHAAAADLAAKYGSSDPSTWKVPATCDKKDPPICDQEVPTDLGAVDTPVFPWQNRGTYHQVVELTGHR